MPPLLLFFLLSYTTTNITTKSTTPAATATTSSTTIIIIIIIIIGDFYDAVSIKLYRLYMNEVYSMDQYGTTYFKISQKATRYAPDNPIVAVHSSGVIVCDKSRSVIKR